VQAVAPQSLQAYYEAVWERFGGPTGDAGSLHDYVTSHRLHVSQWAPWAYP
jgi:hypothetical protein